MGFKAGARGRRLQGGMDPIAEALNSSLGFDWRLAPYDIAGSIAHATMLQKQGIISKDDLDAIERSLDEIAEQIKRGGVSFKAELEDIHMNIEQMLVNSAGQAGMRLHTARSRNDQVATDMRLYTRDKISDLQGAILDLRRAFIDKAHEYASSIMPGYTHLQRAQPVTIGAHMLAYEAMFARDYDRLCDARKRTNVSPLGSGALATTTFDIDRAHTAKSLGMEGISPSSLDAVGDRDFVAEFISTAALVMVHLSRLGEEIILWMSQEFGFAQVGSAYCSTSSIMPQKANPDIAELLRGKAGRVFGNWVAMVTTLKGLPLAYNKDLQESQEPLYDSAETVLACVEVAAAMVRSLSFDTTRTEEAVGQGFVLATELADYLASKGVPFREAHHVVGGLVSDLVAAGKDLRDITVKGLKQYHDAFDADAAAWLTPKRAVSRRNILGGPAPKTVLAAIKVAKKEIERVSKLRI